MSPVADAVGLVDHDQADRAVSDDAPQGLAERFGGDVQQLQFAAAQLSEPLLALSVVERRIEQRGLEAIALERVHLVLHQRDERGHDQDRAAEQLGWDLKRERFAGAGGHDANAVSSIKDRVDDLALAGAKRRVAEDRLQNFLGATAGW